MALISVLMPVFNVERYVKEALRSVQQQTVRDLDIVVVDDGSTDGTLPIVEHIAAIDARIRIFRMDRNRGIPAALNFGLAHCLAPYIARFDGDDVAHPQRLEKELAVLQANPEIALVGCATIGIDENGLPRSGGVVSPVAVSRDEIAKTLLLSTPCLHMWLARRQVYDKLEGYRELTVAEDYDFLLRAATAGFLLSNVPEPLMYLRTRRGNSAHTHAIMHRKAQKYAVRLYYERLHTGSDSFSRENFANAVRAGYLTNLIHNAATSMVKAGFDSRSRTTRMLLCFLASLVSPWQARYFLDRARLRWILRNEATQRDKTCLAPSYQ